MAIADHKHRSLPTGQMPQRTKHVTARMYRTPARRTPQQPRATGVGVFFFAIGFDLFFIKSKEVFF
jgi:hypothetical protein